MTENTASEIKIPTEMAAWEIIKNGPIADPAAPIRFVKRPVPTPGPGEVLVKVIVCGICRTDLHVIEGDLPIHRQNLIPGHQIIGKVVKEGPGASRFAIGDRIGVPWLRHTCGVCKYCRSGRENLCEKSVYTGWDADGGYAEYTTVPEGYAYRIPHQFDSQAAAPLLCAGIIGYRALKRAQIPAGGSLGIYGFGNSAHLTAQLAIAQGTQVHVFTRGEDAKKFALSLGAASAQGDLDPSPVPLDSAIIFAPVGDLIPAALTAVAPGGTVVSAGVHMSDIHELNYEKHLFHEKSVTSVESNTRRDGEEFLTLASRLDIHPTIHRYALKDALKALIRVSKGDAAGACVLQISQED
ncbi:zinc-dependent alcohol dehydrogenase family protein [Oenococcus kitaharae]|uniref:alcohol dehydrogenase n=1 Tax=Oenococcus kitaharae DSM 17330 TaxID=1045004 RepID=G9WG72_9LACO|nr:Alcohol dehydrogenase [Oenococcus kitaharae DSM 17330]OEY83516.1 alcohol dehydrogenase [Oenococcus kitaharae]OEY85315.1 alcohol dehydrogenase [Oenococcus kitaharae]OEY86169.1 alcohol dehydrogenase [Oenococcus kitaharae]